MFASNARLDSTAMWSIELRDSLFEARGLRCFTRMREKYISTVWKKGNENRLIETIHEADEAHKRIIPSVNL